MRTFQENFKMPKRNTGKEKVKRNKGFPYKYRKICIKCGEKYGMDKLDKNNKCPNCIYKRDKHFGISLN